MHSTSATSEMNEQFAGAFYDGESTKHWDAMVFLEEAGLRIVISGSGEAYWPYKSVAKMEHLPRHGGWRLSSRQMRDARLLINDDAFADRLRRHAPKVARGGATPSTAAWIALAIVVAVLAIGVAGVTVGLPYASAKIAAILPDDLKTGLGDATVSRAVGAAPFCDGEAGQQALQALHRRLAGSDTVARDITVRVAAIDKVNAFAAPGGQVVIFEGLLAKAETADEVAGVLAHEIGHVLEQHPTRMAIQSMGIFSLAGLFLGDASMLADAAVQIGATLLVTAYGRDAERDADALAVALLGEANIDPRGLARFFQQLNEKKGEDAGGVLSYFASHPPLEERRERASAAGIAKATPALDESEWTALKNICDG